MKGDISCHTSNDKFRKGHDGIAWDGSEVEVLVDNAGYFKLEHDFSCEVVKEIVDMDKNNFIIP